MKMIMKLLLGLSLIFCVNDLLLQQSTFIQEIKKYRAQQNAEFLNPDKSPLTPEERSAFQGHEFFEADEAYRERQGLNQHQKTNHFH